MGCSEIVIIAGIVGYLLLFNQRHHTKSKKLKSRRPLKSHSHINKSINQQNDFSGNVKDNYSNYPSSSRLRYNQRRYLTI